jgi:hypothetical protein
MGEPKRRGGPPRNPLQGRTSQRAKQSPLPSEGTAPFRFRARNPADGRPTAGVPSPNAPGR